MPLIKINNQVLEIAGRLYSGNVSEMQSSIEYALIKTDYLIIDLNPLQMLDIAGAFMLFLLTNNARQVNKEIIFIGIEKKTIKDVFYLAGIQNFMREAA